MGVVDLSRKLELLDITARHELFEAIDDGSLHSRLGEIGEERIPVNVRLMLLRRKNQVEENVRAEAGESRSSFRARSRAQSRTRQVTSMDDVHKSLEALKEALQWSTDHSAQVIADSEDLVDGALHSEQIAQERQRIAERRSETLEEALAVATSERQADAEKLAEAAERQKQSEALVAQLEAQAEQSVLEVAEARDGLERAEEASRRAELEAAESAEEEAAEARARAQAEVARDFALAAEVDAWRQTAESKAQEEAMVGWDMQLEFAELQRRGEEAERRAGESAARCEEETLAAQRSAVANDVLREQAEDRESRLEAALECLGELRTESLDFEEAAQAARALGAREGEAAEAAEAAEAEEAAVATEALALKAEALHRAREASEEAAQDRRDRLAADEAAEEAEERSREAREAAQQRAREAEAGEEALRHAREEGSRLETALAESEAVAEHVEGKLHVAEQETRSAADEAAALVAELSVQRDLYMEAEAWSVRWEAWAEAKERVASETELGKRVKELQELSDKCEEEAAASREWADECRSEATEWRRSDMKARAELDRERSKNAKLERKAMKVVQILSTSDDDSDDEDSVRADGHSDQSLSLHSDQSWNMVRQTTTHSLLADAMVLNCNGKEIPVRDLKPRMLLKSINAQRDDGLAADEVCVRAVHGTQDPSRRHFVRCAVKESPSIGGSTIDLLPEHLVLAKRSGVSAWHPAQAWELQGDRFSLLEWDETERDGLVATPLQEATDVQPQVRNIIKFEVDGPEGVVFAATDGGPFIALCGSSGLDDEVVLLEYTRSPKEYHRALENSPSLIACRTAIEAQNKPTERDGAKIFLPPLLVEPALEAIKKEGIQLKSYHVIVTRRFMPLVEAARCTLRSNDRVKPREPKPVPYTLHAADHNAATAAGPCADLADENARLPTGGGPVLVVRNTFLTVVSEAPSESGSQPLTTASTTDAHLGPGANHRRRAQRMT